MSEFGKIFNPEWKAKSDYFFTFNRFYSRKLAEIDLYKHQNIISVEDLLVNQT